MLFHMIVTVREILLKLKYWAILLRILDKELDMPSAKCSRIDAYMSYVWIIQFVDELYWKTRIPDNVVYIKTDEIHVQT